MIPRIRHKDLYYPLSRQILAVDDRSDSSEDNQSLLYNIYDDTDAKVESYVLNISDVEVKISVVEGKQAYLNWFRIAAFPRVKTEDIDLMGRQEITEYIQLVSREAIWRAEDIRLAKLLRASLDANPNAIELHVSRSFFQQADFNLLVGLMGLKENTPHYILCNPMDYPDFKCMNTFGMSVGSRVTIPQGTAYCVTGYNQLGVISTLYGIKEVSNDLPEQFYEGWGYDELIAMAILNVNGVGALIKDAV